MDEVLRLPPRSSKYWPSEVCRKWMRLRLVAVGQEVPAVAEQVVVGQVFDLGRSRIARRQVAELGAELQAAVRQDARRQRRVVVRRKVEIPRNPELVAAAAG